MQISHSTVVTLPDNLADQVSKNAWNAAHTITSSASTLLGNPTGSTGNVQEITLGSGLSFSDNTIISTGGGSGSPGSPHFAVQYNDPLGTFAGSSNFIFDGTTATLTNSYTGEAPSGAPFVINNTSASGQNIISFTVQNVAKGQIRSDFNGNLSYAAYGSGVHTFYVGGDYPGGTPTVILGLTTSLDGGGILTDGAGALEVATQITWGSAAGPWTLAANGSIVSSLWSISGVDGHVSFDAASFTSDGAGNVTANNFTANSAVNTSVLNATGVITFSKAGASSASAVNITGTPFSGTGTTSTPLMYFNNAVTQPTTWTTGGTYLGVNAVSGYTGNFLNFRLNGGSSLFTVDVNGAVTSASNGNFANVTASAGGHLNFSGQAQIFSPSDGILELTNAAKTDFTRLQFGGTTSSFPAIKRNAAGLDFRLADDSAACVITSAGHTITSASANSLAVGLNGATNPVLQIDSSIASQAAGVSIQGGAAGGGTTIQCISSASTEKMFVLAKGSQILYTGSSSSGGQQNIYLGGTTVASFVFSQTSFTPQASSTASTIRFSTTAINDTALTASTEATWAYFNMTATRQHATGALTLQRDFRITPSTHSFVGASTLAEAVAFAIDGAPSGGTNATLTQSEGLLVSVIALTNVTNGFGAVFNAPTGASTLNQAALFNGDVGYTSGNILINTAGKGLSIKSGSNARIGTGTLSGGTLAVANTSVTANTRVFLADTTSGALTNVGTFTVVTSAGVGFTVTSTNVLDTSTFNWILFESA